MINFWRKVFNVEEEIKYEPPTKPSIPTDILNLLADYEKIADFLQENYTQLLSYSSSISIFLLLVVLVYIIRYLFKDKKLHPGSPGYYNLLKQVHNTVSHNQYEENLACMTILRLYPEMVNASMKPYDFTPFLRACWIGNAALVSFMIRHGADIEKTTLHGENGFYLASFQVAKMKPENWDPSVLEVLVNAGVDVNRTNKKGIGALHIAAKEGHLLLTKWLLNHGANPDAGNGPHPLDIAHSYQDEKHKEVEYLLAKYSYRPIRAYKDLKELCVTSNKDH